MPLELSLDQHGLAAERMEPIILRPSITRSWAVCRRSEQSRAIMRIFYVIETEGSAGRDLMLAIAATRTERDTRPCPPT